jgi:hypothetical protein
MEDLPHLDRIAPPRRRRPTNARVPHARACVFVSTENSADDRACRVIDGLRAGGLQVTCSPLNPALGYDPRWTSWYKTGCKAAIEATDMFVPVVTAGYDCSTWMATACTRR